MVIKTKPSLSGFRGDASAKAYEALGRFVSEYAWVETAFHMLFRHYTGLPDDTARLISGGMSSEQLRKAAKALASLNKEEPQTLKEVEWLFGQFADITKLRNNVVHRSVFVNEDQLISSTILTAKRKDDYEVLRASLKDISAATEDLSTIYLRIILLINPNSDWLIADVKKALFAPWLYIHLEPENPNQELQRIPQSA
jgi:hypothetical protein